MKFLKNLFYLTTLAAILLLSKSAYAQESNKKVRNAVYMDKQGVLRYTKTQTEASFFGVNYTTPFAYAYRAHKALNVDPEKAIQQDVYHFARLGFDAFRVHVWDTEISDSAGNLLENEHLRLFDFLLAELKKRNIKTIITPIAFWGNGYPEKDEPTPGFSRFYGRGKLTTNDTAVKAQENYMRQFFKHMNPYTKLSYEDDKDIIAVEINNEPSHSGLKAGVTNYINRLAAAIKSTGWSKPVFYNISQSPYYADAVAASLVDGFSFQWYPSGLVAGQALKGNYLPHVDAYQIPYRDTIPSFAGKALMVYEFDAADLLQSYMYPAMAKSFKGAGFQWATQFAYDPMALAYANTEYQTHYLNLAYTPSKAISMSIAGEVFHRIPRLKKYGVYPSDSLFDAFRVSYKNELSEMNSEQKFYYSNTTLSKPVNSTALTNIAGVGSSPIINYPGTGAYFLDKLQEGTWRLELMPDAIHIRDPFEKPSPKKVVTAIRWSSYQMEIKLPDLDTGFNIKGLNEGNSYSGMATAGSFYVTPGTYLLTRKGQAFSGSQQKMGVIGLNEFVAPKPFNNEIVVRHEPMTEVSAGKPFIISAVISHDDTAKVFLQAGRLGGGPTRNIPMIKKTGNTFIAEVPAGMVTPGQVTYRIIVHQGNDYAAFPGNVKGNPLAWDSYNFETWKTNIVGPNAALELYNAAIDRNIFIHSSNRRNFQTSYVTGDNSRNLVQRLSATGMQNNDVIGFQYFVGDKLRSRQIEPDSFDKIIIRARTASADPVDVKCTFITNDAIAFSSGILLSDNFRDIEILIKDLSIDSSLLLPRPYPGFQSLWFKQAGSKQLFQIKNLDKIEITAGPYYSPTANNKTYTIEIESVQLAKRK